MTLANDNKPVHVEFLTALFGETEKRLYFQSLANDSASDEGKIKPPLMTREIPSINGFVAKHDRSGRGLFFCVGTLKDGAATRNKDNISETIGWHTDLDFKSIAEPEPLIRERLSTLPCQPTVRVRSGGGLHCYWLFREPIDAQEYRDVIEDGLRRLADVLAGDPAVCEISRLMRLPGTHNSKYGDMREVILETVDGPRYELEDLEEWLAEQKPILTRKVAEPAPGRKAPPVDDNPYLAHARQWGYKPRLDVDAALRDMSEGTIHVTLRNVSASLIQAGQPIEEVVGILMEAARGIGGPDWNWRAEETKIRKLCESALKKFPPKPDPVSHETDASEGPAEAPEGTIDLGAARAQRKARQTTKDGDKVDHIDIGTLFLNIMREVGHSLMFTKQGSYSYEDNLWQLQDDKSLRAWLDTRLEAIVRQTKAKSNIKIINEARAWIIRHPELQKKNIEFDAHGMVPTLSGLIDPKTGTLHPATPEHFCTWRVPIAYDPEAQCPYWRQVLEEAFADRSPGVRFDYVSLIQEWMGVGLIDRKAKGLSRAIAFVGGSNSGKSTLLDVISGLYSKHQNTTPIDALDEAHGTMVFASRIPWILHEAFDASKWHISSKVKALIEGRPIQINIKNGRIIDCIYTAPVAWGANAQPQFKEATKAITNRLLLIECRREFDERQPVGAAAIARSHGFDRPSDLVLREEMPGVLAWALAGLQIALDRGHFRIPHETTAALEGIQRDSNIVQGFVEDCVDFDPNGMVSTPDFSAAFSSWWLEHKGGDTRIPSGDSVGKALKALSNPRIAIDPLLRSNSRRYYGGVQLNAEGRRHWDNSVASDAFVFQGRKASTTAAGGNPNGAIPPAWIDKDAIRAMRAAHNGDVSRGPDGDTSHGVERDTVTGRATNGSATMSPNQNTDDAEEIPF